MPEKQEPMYVQGDAKGVLVGHDLGNENFWQHGVPRTVGGPELERTLASVTRRSGFNRNDLTRHRPEDSLPTKHDDIIKACQAVYRKVGVVRNVIDLMADFAGEGIELVHPNKRQEVFYREWARRVKLDERARNFMKCMLRDANVIVRRKMAAITPQLRRELHSLAARQQKSQIPWSYVFISPVVVRKTGKQLGQFVGQTPLEMVLDSRLASAIKHPKTDAEKALVEQIPVDIREAVAAGKKTIPLDMNFIYVAHYKKDDWEEWATPFLYAILDDILYKEKMRTADLAALDGVINVIRLWKLGRSDQKILPTKSAANKLIGILQNNVGGGTLDIVWDDMIDLQTDYPPIDKILGAEKYISVDTDIIRGLGVPGSLIGGVGDTGRNTQSTFVQLKTLIERLEYVRGECIRWLQNELTLIRKAMRWQRLPNIQFGVMNLRDEAAEKKLLLQLLDRGVVSIEAVLKGFGHDYVIELERMRREQQTRNQDAPLIERAGPFYRPKSVMDLQQKHAMELAQNKGGPNNLGDLPRQTTDSPEPGRPPGTPDTEKRKRNTKMLSDDSVLVVVADGLLEALDAVFDKRFLAEKKVSNLRSLSQSDKRELEMLKWYALCSLDGESTRPDSDAVLARIEGADKEAVRAMNETLNRLFGSFEARLGRLPTVAERRRMMSIAWASARLHAQKTTDAVAAMIDHPRRARPG